MHSGEKLPDILINNYYGLDDDAKPFIDLLRIEDAAEGMPRFRKFEIKVNEDVILEGQPALPVTHRIYAEILNYCMNSDGLIDWEYGEGPLGTMLPLHFKYKEALLASLGYEPPVSYMVVTSQPRQMVDRRSWDEFRATGLFLFVNSFLHIFGWCLAYDPDKDICYPARCKFRGFAEDNVSRAYINLSRFVEENATDLREEAESE